MTDQTPLQRLHRVQELDLSLDRLRDEEANFPEALRAARAEQDRLNNELEETEITLEGVEKRVKQAEFDLTSVRDQIARAKEEQEKNAFDARAQSQYGSRLQQLEERLEEMEEDLAPLRERQRELTEKASGLREQHRTGRPGLAELEGADEKRIKGLHAQGENSRTERAELVGGLDSRTVKEYDQIRKAKKGLGLAEVKAGRCSACNVMLPVNIQQKVALGNIPPVKCPSCGRFLIRLDM
ncbi:zinc ribbon domain-containing protein [Deinococcus sp.]|uniref:zinc ribbon domain-containing protein n=1 Tax=Deinococcus sp. TaxID=47478 RepID=UPI0025C25781|nr:zinc ribbon domain-containing protein [Deinococcus sp.]